jgi:hypothetical protein
VIVLSRVDVPGASKARDTWLRELRARQLNGRLGWTTDDPGFGGWGYSVTPPAKAGGSEAEGPRADSDLSSTLFALGALRLSGASSDDPAVRDALTFVESCQNFSRDPQSADPSHDDGGFFFSPTDPVRNKAGSAGRDRLGRERYHSYGSATADGLRALLRCGLAGDHPRVSAARRWLEAQFSATTNPGVFEPAREPERDATYYYYCWSLAHAFRAAGATRFEANGRTVDWAREMARELIGRQRNDGTWVNGFSASKEDDPLIATPFATGALAICRSFLPSTP